jgi:uncharacterized integral membrane protein (TIGR00697 family)
VSYRTLKTILLVSVSYVGAQLLSDIASLRIVFVAGLSVDAGTFIYPFTFTLRDLIHKTAGIRIARLLIITAAAINVLMAGYLWMVSVLPADPVVGPQEEFGRVLSPVWRIVFASILAEVIAELVDGEVYQRWVNRVGHRYQWGRVLASNAVSVPLDSALFVLVAFGGLLPVVVVLAIFWSNVLIKGVTTLLSIPLIYSTGAIDTAKKPVLAD